MVQPDLRRPDRRDRLSRSVLVLLHLLGVRSRSEDGDPGAARPCRNRHAGPPYTTDDPEPVEYRHWEFYLATQDTSTSSESSGTAPHVEINYGVVPNVQLHAIVPLAYDHADGATSYGVGDIELGAKVRFVQESGKRPMVGVFPLLELPVGDESKGLGTGHVHAFLPVWLQNSSGPWQSYGGGGYWINPGTGNRNYWLFGWQPQRRADQGPEPRRGALLHDAGSRSAATPI